MTRHELKEQLQHDHFTDAVSDVLSYALSNRDVLIRWLIGAAIVIALGVGAFLFSSSRRAVRQQALDAALRIVESPVAEVGSPRQLPNSYPNKESKRQAEVKALSDVVTKYGGSREGLIAQYYLGTMKVQMSDAKGAESDLKRVADSSSDFAALAKIALAQLYAGENRISEARAILQQIVNKPSDLVSKTQADIILAQLDATTNPEETKKILQSLRGPKQSPAVTRAVDQISGELTR